MEGTKKPASSSFTSDLFGSKETSASSSSGIFNSIFPPPSKGHGSMNSEQSKQDSVVQERNTKGGSTGSTTTSNEAASQAAQNKQPSSFYQNEKVQPCHLSSSIYYGGQDVYSFPPNNQSSTYTTVLDLSVEVFETNIIFQERRGSPHFRSTKIMEKMILAARLEETGGKGLFTTSAHHQ